MSKKIKDNKPSGRIKKTLLTALSVILILILVAAAILGFKFRSHIKAAIIWLTTSDEDIQKNIDKAKDKQTEVLNNSGFYASKELDEALTTGKITAEEHTQILIGNLTLEDVLAKQETSSPNQPGVETPQDETQNSDETQINDTQTEDTSPAEKPETDSDEGQSKEPSGNSEVKQEDGKKPADKTPGKSDPPVNDKKEDAVKPSTGTAQQTQTGSDADKRIAELVTKMYVLKADYTGAVEGVVSSMKADYSKLPAEQRTKSAKQSIAAGYMSKINAMEAQCDAQVNAIVTELRQILKENGRDMSLADAIVSTYASEKENTKAYYLSTYGD